VPNDSGSAPLALENPRVKLRQDGRVKAGLILPSSTSSVIIDDFNIVSIIRFPGETYSPSIVDPDTVLPSSIPFQFFKPIGWWDAKICQIFRVMEIPKFSIGYLLDVRRQFSRAFSPKDVLSLRISDRFDHPRII
jgi:hypothetical protein